MHKLIDGIATVRKKIANVLYQLAVNVIGLIASLAILVIIGIDMANYVLRIKWIILKRHFGNWCSRCNRKKGLSTVETSDE